jgi:hypothetical protein
MRMEIYRGIEFVRISSMPEEQQALIRQTLDKLKIVKILREQELLNDCVLMTDYEEWMAATKQPEKEAAVVSRASTSFRLAFK